MPPIARLSRKLSRTKPPDSLLFVRCLASFSLSAQLWLAGSGVLSAPLHFSPDGDANAGLLDCQLPISALGPLSLRNGSVQIGGNVIAVSASPEYLAPLRVILSGCVIRTEETRMTSDVRLTGLAFFDSGQMLSQIEDASQEDLVFRNDGALRGRILSADSNQLTISSADGSRRTIDCSTILFIRSPRAFTFTVTGRHVREALAGGEILGESEVLSFRPTAPQRVLSPTSILPTHTADLDGEAEGNEDNDIWTFSNSIAPPASDPGEPFLPFSHRTRTPHVLP